MKPIAIFYATREGQSRRIAEHLAHFFRERGLSARPRDVRALREPFGMDRFGAAILAASVHLGKHEPEMVEFVKRHRDALERIPNAFLSVSLSEAGAEDPKRSADDRAKSVADTEMMIRTFVDATEWHPEHTKAVAGALTYSKYNFIVRFFMKRIAKRGGAPTDTSRDHELTDWKSLDRFADDFVSEVDGRKPAAAAVM